MKLIQTIKHGTYTHALKRIRHEMSNTIVVAGSRRSGTSWLMEVIRSLPGYKSLSEPLMYDEARSFGIGERTFIAPNASHERACAYFEKVLTGQVANLSTWHFERERPFGKLYEYLKQDRLIVKLCRASGMLSWIGNTFELRGIVLIIRHPCAVVASLKRLWDQVREESLCNMLNDQLNRQAQSDLPIDVPVPLLERFSDVIATAQTRAERIAVMWCLDHYALFRYYEEDNYPWLLVPYEELLMNGEQELRRIATFLGSGVSGVAQKQLASPSFSTRNLHRDPSSQLSKWKNQLSKAEVDQVIRTVEAFDLGVYSSKPRPDLIQLSDFQCRDAPPVSPSTTLSRKL